MQVTLVYAKRWGIGIQKAQGLVLAHFISGSGKPLQK